jgi:hypothetical protein
VPEPASLVNGLTWHFAGLLAGDRLLKFQRVSVEHSSENPSQ